VSSDIRNLEAKKQQRKIHLFQLSLVGLMMH